MCAHGARCAILAIRNTSQVNQSITFMFSEELKALRTRLGLTQQEMADRLNMDRSNYSRLEHKEHPPAHLLDRIHKEFQVDAWSWMRPVEPEEREEQGPRLVHLRNAHDQEPAEESNWRLKAVDLLGRITDLLASMIKDPSKRGGGGGVTRIPAMEQPKAPDRSGAFLLMVYGIGF